MIARQRVRHRARTYLSESPAAYLPVARRRYPGPSPEVVGPTTELVIDGYTRCGSTHTVYAFQLAQPRPVRLAHHLHAPAQVITAVRHGLPALVVIRQPRAAVLSQLVREPTVDVRDALVAFARFYERLLPYRDDTVVGDFSQLTTDLAPVVRRLNAHFGTGFAEPRRDEAADRECRALVTARSSLSPTLLGFESGLVTTEELRAARQVVAGVVHYGGVPPAKVEGLWVPTPEREQAKAALGGVWDASPLRLRARADRAYAAFLGGQ